MLTSIKEKIPLNWELMAHPVNWIALTLMMWIAGLALALVFHPANFVPSDNND